MSSSGGGVSKLRVHDMAGEFGISADEVMGLLRTMDVPVRTHFSPLTDEQVARVRARWEREKRARVEKPAPAPRRRRGAAAPSEAPAAAPLGGWRDRRAPSPATSRAVTGRSRRRRSRRDRGCRSGARGCGVQRSSVYRGSQCARSGVHGRRRSSTPCRAPRVRPAGRECPRGTHARHSGQRGSRAGRCS